MSKGKLLKGILSGLIGMLICFSSAYAAVAPDTTKLFTISNVYFPGDIISPASGYIYVTDSVNGHVRIYTARGVLTGSVTLNFKPSAIAVSPSGLLYIAGKNRIDLYSGSTFVASYKNVVSSPSSMVFLNGRLYVADGYFIKVFDSNMNKLFEFGGYAGSDNIQRDGKFNGLDDIAVDYNNSQLYVLDKGAIATVISNGRNWGLTYVWRVQVFDENGNFIRSFSNYGFEQEGKIGSASSIAVDKDSRVYVADNVQNIIAVYDSYGSYLKTIYSLADPVYNPVDIFFNNDRLYVASNMAKSIYVFAIDLYAYLKVEPSNLQFTLQGGQANGSVNILNEGTGLLNFTASSSADWLNLTPNGGSAGAGSSISVNVTVNSRGLSPGIYNGTIEITSNGGSGRIPVTLNVIAPPALTVTPLTFDLVKKKGSPVEPLIVNISLLNDLSGSMTWSAISDSPWLRITPGTGSSNSTISANILVDTNLEPGRYTGHITVVANGAEGSPATITVNLEIRANRKVTVTSNIEAASFTITGPVTYEGTGPSYVIDNAPSGTYTITFRPVKGYRTPSPQSGTLPVEGELTFSGEYRSLGNMLNIIASHGPGYKDNMEIRIFNGDGQPLRTITPLKPYNRGATTAAGDINGDGINELIIGTGPGAKVPPVVTVIDIDGNLIGEFKPFSGIGYGVEVAAADLDLDGSAEIIVGKTKKFAGTPLLDLKVFKYKEGQFIDTGVRLKHRGANGIRIASADLNEDGIPEVLVVPARGNAPVYVYHVDTSQDTWTASLITQYTGCNGSGGSNITTADTDGNAIPEIILSCHYESGTVVRILDASGKLVREFSTGSALKDYITAGDLDNDGIAEIIVGDGPAAHKKAVKIFNPEGGLLRSFDAFGDSFGIRISTGRFE